MTLTESGKYGFTLRRGTYTYPLAGLNRLILSVSGTPGNKSFTLNSLTVIDGGASFDKNSKGVIIGRNAKASNNEASIVVGENAAYTAANSSGVVIGVNAKTDIQNGTVIGENADGNWNNTFGCAYGTDLVAVGAGSKAYGWRTTAIGASAGAAGQSSTAFGAGAFAGVSHAVAFGRGGFVTPFPYGNGYLYSGSILSGETSQIYFGNGWGHRYPDHPVNNEQYGVDVPGNLPTYKPIVFHGPDAYDARPIPDSFNISGGDLIMASGRGTGTGASGKFQIATAPIVQGTGQNEKNPLVVALQVDGSTTSSDGTRLMLLDISTGTMKRVKIAPADGNGRKMLYID